MERRHPALKGQKCGLEISNDTYSYSVSDLLTYVSDAYDRYEFNLKPQSHLDCYLKACADIADIVQDTPRREPQTAILQKIMFLAGDARRGKLDIPGVQDKPPHQPMISIIRTAYRKKHQL